MLCIAGAGYGGEGWACAVSLQGYFSGVRRVLALCLWGREKVLGGREMCYPESPLARDRAGPGASGCPLPMPSHAAEMGKDKR